MRYFIKLSFDGSSFHGWQKQVNAVAVQDVLEQALAMVLGKQTEIYGCGRTDTGVHASQFYAHFESEVKLDTFRMPIQLNSLLPKTVAVHSVFDVATDAHARFSALTRTYHYYYHFERSPFLRSFSNLYLGKLPDLDLLNACCNIVKSNTYFEAFSRSRTQVNNYNCTIHEAFWFFENKQLIFTVTANRFLRNMVRAMVGTMIQVGTKKISLVDFEEILKSGDRKQAGISAAACGLFLSKIQYPEHLNIL